MQLVHTQTAFCRHNSYRKDGKVISEKHFDELLAMHTFTIHQKDSIDRNGEIIHRTYYTQQVL